MCLYWTWVLVVAKSSWSCLKPMGRESAQQCCSFIWVTCEPFWQERKETSCFVQFLIELCTYFFYLTRGQGFKWAQNILGHSFRGVGQLLAVKCSEINAGYECRSSSLPILRSRGGAWGSSRCLPQPHQIPPVLRTYCCQRCSCLPAHFLCCCAHSAGHRARGWGVAISPHQS